MPHASRHQSLKCQESEAKKGALVEKVPAKKMGDLEMPQIHLAAWTDLVVFKNQEGNGAGELG